MNHVTGRPKMVIANFLDVVEQLYGEAEAKKAKEVIMGSPSWKWAIAEAEGL